MMLEGCFGAKRDYRTPLQEKELCPRDDFRFFGRCEHLALLQSSVPTGMERPLVCIKPPFTEKLNVDMAG